MLRQNPPKNHSEKRTSKDARQRDESDVRWIHKRLLRISFAIEVIVIIVKALWFRSLRAYLLLLLSLVPRAGQSLCDDLSVRIRQLLWPKVKGQLVDRAGECERQLVVIVHCCTSIAPNVEGLVYGHQ